jgi:uncharacterized protein (DUF1800 family)
MAQDPTTIAYRFGYGLPLPQDAPTDVAAMLAALGRPDAMALRHPGLGFAAALPILREVQSTRKMQKGDTAKKPLYRKALLASDRVALANAHAGIAQALDAPDGFRERLVRFWTDHFSTTAKNRQLRLLPGTLIEDAIRPHVTARFADMLKAVTLHPAMLVYLDQVLSIGPTSRAGRKQNKGLNENLARELMELHTLGVNASYGQDDVRQMAELLTGLAVDFDKGFVFEPRRAEPGAETVLGISYSGDGTAPILKALDDLAMRPETADHIARKLAVHFVSDQPDADLVAHIRAAYLRTGGDLVAIYGALLDHPATWMPEQTKVRQPFDFIVASLRALSITGDTVIKASDKQFQKFVVQPMDAMGQPMQGPPGPDGWREDAAAWINPGGLAARINWAMEMPVQLAPELPTPLDLAKRALGPRAGKQLLWAVERAETTREGVGLVLASAEFNRR